MSVIRGHRGRKMGDGALSGRTIRPLNPISQGEAAKPRPESVTEDIQHQRELAERILELLEPGPLNEEEISLRVGASREQVESICLVLKREKKVRVSKKWSWPKEWRLA